MADGSTKAIEEIVHGDWIIADEPTDDLPAAAFLVMATQRNFTQRVISISVRDSLDQVGSLEATGEHPFWTQTDGWVAADELVVGDLLLDANGDVVEVVAVSVASFEARTFNLTVDGAHTYFVVAAGASVLVHNQGPGGRPAVEGDPYHPAEVDRRRTEWRRELGAPSLDPDSPIPDQGSGRDMGGHDARGRTPHATGERNVNSAEEHSRVPKGAGRGTPQRGCP